MPESQQNRHSTDIGPKLSEIPVAIKPLDLSAKTEVIADATQDIKNTLSPMHGPAEHTNVTSIPEIGASVKLYNKGVEFPAKVARIEKTAKGVQIIVEAGPEFPDPKFADGVKREYPMSPSDFAGLFGPKNTKDTAVPVAQSESPESKYAAVIDTIDQVVLQETLSKFAGREIPQAIIDAQLGIVAYDLAEAGFPEKYVEVAKELLADFKAHNAPLQAAKVSAAVVENTNKKNVPEWQQAMIDHPDLEKKVAELDQKVQKLINSQEFQAQPINSHARVYSPDSSTYAYPRVLREAKGLPGMTTQIFETLQKKWDKELGRATELAAPLNTLASLIASYQAKTETKILNNEQKSIVDAIRNVPNLSQAQRDILLTQAAKQIREHNDSVDSIQSARRALENALKEANPIDEAQFLAMIDQINNLSAEEKNTLKADFATQINAHNKRIDEAPEIDMSGTTDITMNLPTQKSDTIEVNDHELADVPLKDPNFDKLIDSVDEFAKKLQTDLGRQKSNRGEMIDLTDLHSQLVNALVDAGLSPVSVQAKEWLATKEETARQINTGVQELNRIEALVTECQNTIDDDLESAGETTPEEINALQEKIDLLPNGDDKTELQGRILELHEHNKGLAAADELLRVALASNTAIDESTLNQAIGNVLPKAVDNYLSAASDLINDHNLKFPPAEEPQDAAIPEETATNNQPIDTQASVDNTSFEPTTAVSNANEQSEPTATTGPGPQDNVPTMTPSDTSEPPVNTVASPSNYAPAGQKTMAFNTMAMPNVSSPEPATDTLVTSAKINIAPPAAANTVVDNPLPTPSVVPPSPDTNTPVDTTVVAPAIDVLPDPIATPAATVVDVPVADASTVATQSPDASKTAPAAVVTPDPTVAPVADVLGVAPVVRRVDVPATEMTPEQKLSFEKSRDQIIDQVEKSLILSEDEKTRLVIKAVELLRTANKNTNVLAELQKLMVAGERHQSIQDALLSSEQIADQIQTAVVDALDTNSLDHKASDAAFQDVLANLPTDQARASLQAIYDQAIGDKKLRGNPKKIKDLVEKALADLADQNSSRTESLKPLFKKINAQVKAHIRQGEAQVLGSQTIEPSLADWEKPVPTEAELAAEKMTRTQKLRQKLGGLVDRMRGKAADTTSEEAQDDVDETADTPKSQADIVAGMVDNNPDLTADEKTKLKAKVLELLEKGTDINKTLEQLSQTLADRDEVNKKITALVLNAPDLSKKMYFTLSAALQDDLSEEKRREALMSWQSTVDAQVTDRAKQILKQVYQAAIKDRNLSGNVDKLEDMIANGLAETGMIDARRDAVLNLVNTLSSEINKTITARKGPDTATPVEAVVDEPKATEAVAQAVPDTQPKAPEAIVSTPQVSEVLAAQPKEQVENNDAAEKQRLFLVGIENLIATSRASGIDLDQNTLHMYALKSNKLDRTILADTLVKIDQLLAGEALDLVGATVKAAISGVTEKIDLDPKAVDQKLRDKLVDDIKAINLKGQAADRDVSPKEFFASDLDQLMKAMNTVNDADLNQELKSIRTLLVDAQADEVIGGEAIGRLERALAKYPEVLKTLQPDLVIHIQDHNTRVAMAAEIAKREKVTMENILTTKSEDISAQIKALEGKFGSMINKHAVENALVKLNDTLRLAQTTTAAMAEISNIWDTEPTLALDKVKQVLADKQLDPKIMDKIVDLLRQTAPVINQATAEKRRISGSERGHVMFELIPDMTDVPVALKEALAKKMTKMFDNLNKQNTAPTAATLSQSA